MRHIDRKCNKTLTSNYFIWKNEHIILLNEIRSKCGGLRDVAKSSNDEVRISESHLDLFHDFILSGSNKYMFAEKTGKTILFVLLLLLLLYFRSTKFCHEAEYASGCNDRNDSRHRNWEISALHLPQHASLFVMATMMLPRSQPHGRKLSRQIGSTRCLIEDAPLACSYSEVHLRRTSDLRSHDSFVEVDNENPTVQLVPYTLSESKVDSSWDMSLKIEPGTSHFTSFSGHSHFEVIRPFRRKVVKFGLFGTLLASLLLVLMSPLCFMATKAAHNSYGIVHSRFLYKCTPIYTRTVWQIRMLCPQLIIRLRHFHLHGCLKWLYLRQFSNSSSRTGSEIDYNKFNFKRIKTSELKEIVRINLKKSANWTLNIPTPKDNSVSSVLLFISKPKIFTEMVNSLKSHSMDQSVHSDYPAVSSISDPIPSRTQIECADDMTLLTNSGPKDSSAECQSLGHPYSQSINVQDQPLGPNLPTVSSSYASRIDIACETTDIKYAFNNHLDSISHSSEETSETSCLEVDHSQKISLHKNTPNCRTKVPPLQCSLEAMDWKHSSTLVLGRDITYKFSRTTDDVTFKSSKTIQQDRSKELVVCEGASLLPDNDSAMIHDYSINPNIWISACNIDHEHYSSSAKAFNGICHED